ncbi:MAG: MBL fold metallo-hydrolase [Dehalococcoidia bacterium]
MEIIPGVHQIEGVRGSRAYLLVDTTLVLIDTGIAGNEEPILQYIASLGRDPRELHSILLTHSHPDHTGSAPQLRRQAKARVLIHEGDSRVDERGRIWASYMPSLEQLRWRLPLVYKVRADETLTEGDVIPVLGGVQVVHTPGHTPGSAAFYLKELGALFTGDTLLCDGGRFSRAFSPFPRSNFRAFHSSVQRLGSLDFEAALAGHGTPIVREAGAKLRHMLQRYAQAGVLERFMRNTPLLFNLATDLRILAD